MEFYLKNHRKDLLLISIHSSIKYNKNIYLRKNINIIFYLKKICLKLCPLFNFLNFDPMEIVDACADQPDF